MVRGPVNDDDLVTLAGNDQLVDDYRTVFEYAKARAASLNQQTITPQVGRYVIFI